MKSLAVRVRKCTDVNLVNTRKLGIKYKDIENRKKLRLIQRKLNYC